MCSDRVDTRPTYSTSVPTETVPAVTTAGALLRDLAKHAYHSCDVSHESFAIAHATFLLKFLNKEFSSTAMHL